MTRRPACIILTATTGDARAAKAIFSRVARQVLGRDYTGEPHHCYYYRRRDLEPGVPTRWVLEVNDAEYAALVAAVGPAYAAEGWTGVPLDCYHD